MAALDRNDRSWLDQLSDEGLGAGAGVDGVVGVVALLESLDFGASFESAGLDSADESDDDSELLGA